MHHVGTAALSYLQIIAALRGFCPPVALVHGYYPTNSAAYFKNDSYSQALSGKFFEI
jgi:hypothetical protein